MINFKAAVLEAVHGFGHGSIDAVAQVDGSGAVVVELLDSRKEAPAVDLRIMNNARLLTEGNDDKWMECK